MALVSKFTGGKRTNLTKRGGYEMRSVGAALSHSSGPSWHLGPSSYKCVTIGQTFNKVFIRRANKAAKRKASSAPRSLKRRKVFAGPDKNYGPHASQPDISEEAMLEEAKKFLLRLKNKVPSITVQKKLEEETRGQHDNELWRELRKNMLTASNFGTVINRKETTSPHNLVKNLLYGGEVFSKSMEYGRINETVALNLYEIQNDVVVERCGLYIDFENPYLGASPDGLVGTKGIVEVKCLVSLKGEDILATNKKKCYTVEGNQIR